MKLSDIAQSALDELPPHERHIFKAAAEAAEHWSRASGEVRERDMYCFRAGFLAGLRAIESRTAAATTTATVSANLPLRVLSRPDGSNCELICETVATHAIERWRERTKSKQSDIQVLNRFRKMLANAERWKLKQKYEASEIWQHGIPAKYWKQGAFIFVVENRCVVTVHEGAAKRWEPVK